MDLITKLGTDMKCVNKFVIFVAATRVFMLSKLSQNIYVKLLVYLDFIFSLFKREKLESYKIYDTAI